MRQKINVLLLICLLFTLNSCWIVLVGPLVGFRNDDPAIKKYKFKDYTKAELYIKIKKVLKDNPEYFIPKKDTLRVRFNHYSLYISGEKQTASEIQMSSDSICFHFKLKQNDSTILIYWLQMVGIDDWTNNSRLSTELALCGISEDYRNFRRKRSFTLSERRKYRKYVKLFTREIISKLKSK
jgi:hypothetical protein